MRKKSDPPATFAYHYISPTLEIHIPQHGHGSEREDMACLPFHSQREGEEGGGKFKRPEQTLMKEDEIVPMPFIPYKH